MCWDAWRDVQSSTRKGDVLSESLHSRGLEQLVRQSSRVRRDRRAFGAAKTCDRQCGDHVVIWTARSGAIKMYGQGRGQSALISERVGQAVEVDVTQLGAQNAPRDVSSCRFELDAHGCS